MTNGAACVTLHNVTEGEVYELMSSPVLPATKWNPNKPFSPCPTRIGFQQRCRCWTGRKRFSFARGTGRESTRIRIQPLIGGTWVNYARR